MFSDRKLGVWVVALGAVCFLFVVICPLAPTPAALTASHGTHVCSPGASALQPVPSPSQLFATPGALAAGSMASAAAHLLQPAARPACGKLVNLTCVRLC